VTHLVPQVKEALRGMWQGRWFGLAVAWIAALAGITWVWLTPDRYEATARVYVDTQSMLRPLLSGLTVQPNVDQEVALLSRTLISRPNLQKLVRMTDMDLRVKTSEERERLIDELMRQLYIRSVGQQNLYILGFTHPNPSEAGRVVQSLLSIFVESGLSAKGNDTAQARRFIEEQIKVYEQKLTEAENRVKEFKLKNMELAGPQGGDFFSSMSQVSQQLREAQLALQEAQQSRDAIKKMIADEKTQSSSAGPGNDEPLASVATPELDERLRTLNKNLDDLLLRYTESHPDVINTRRIIKEVEAQRDDERKRLAEQNKRRVVATGDAAGGYTSQLKMSLAEAEAQVAGLQARVADFEKRLATLRERARSVPEREAEFAQLNRDYGIQKQNYEGLVARREAANMSAEVGAATGVADFRIIDPPRVSPTPVAPNRKLLLPLVVLAALGAGLAVSYLYSLVRPTFYESRVLKGVGQRPVLGSVSLVLNPAIVARRRRNNTWFFGGIGALVATCGALVAVIFLRGLLPF
jgi:polysaccharide chain length determinant protein (PEP-CTERM system associated)